MTTPEIVVGIDKSPASVAALAWAAAYARTTGASLRAIHVLAWPPTGDLYGYSVVADSVLGDPDVIDEMVRQPVERLFASSGPEPGWTLQFGEGHPGRVLVEESANATLLVVGCQEHTGLARLLVGSVSHYAVNHAVCPVVAVPAGPSVTRAHPTATETARPAAQS